MSTPIRRGPRRRAAAIAALAALAGMGAWNSLQSVWFTGAFTENGNVVWSKLTVNELANHGMIQAPTGTVTATYTIFGMPAPQAWLLIGLGLLGISVLLRLSLFSLVGVAMVWISRTAAVAAETALMAPAAGGRFVRSGNEFTNYLDLCWVVMGIGLVLAVQLTYASAVERRNAEREGRTLEPGVLDTFQAMGESFTDRLNRTPRQNAGASSTTASTRETQRSDSNKTLQKA